MEPITLGNVQRWILISAAAAAIASPAAGSVIFGLDAFGQIETTLDGGSGAYENTGGTGGYIQQSSYSLLPSLQSQQSGQIFDNVNGTFYYSASTQASVDQLFTNGINGDLHLSLESSGGSADPDPTSANEVQGFAYAYIYWEDVWSVTSTGLASGTPVLFEVLTNLDGSVTSGGNQTTLLYDAAQISPNAGFVNASADQCSALAASYAGGQPTNSSINQTSTNYSAVNSQTAYYFCATVGDTFSVLEQLWGEVNGSGLWSGQVIANDTADIAIVPLSPGFTITSASGEKYSAASIPEPSTLVFFLPPLALLAARRALRARGYFQSRRLSTASMCLFAALFAGLAARGDTIAPYSVNNNGLIVGQDYTSAGLYESFLFNQNTGAFTFLTPPGATNSIAVGINDSNQIVGAYVNSAGNYGYSYSGGAFSTLSVPGANVSTPFFYNGGAGTIASGINDSGDIVGDWSPSAASPGQGFLYNGTSFTNRAILDGSALTFLYGINDSGEISGYTETGVGASRALSSFTYSAGVFTGVNFPGASSTVVQGINNSGVVVGFYTLDGVTSGFVYLDGSFTTIVYPGASATDLFGISNNGEIVGTYTCSSGCSDPAFYAIPQVGGGYSFQTIGAPTPEPGTIALLGAGLAALAIRRYRARRRSLL